MAHASQFIVEYAGDYQTQAANGGPAGVGPDGQLDFFYDLTGTKRIRWYGLPRYDPAVPHYPIPQPPTPPPPAIASTLAPSGYFPDVLPLRDFLYQIAVANSTLLPTPTNGGTNPSFYTLPFSPEKYVSFPIAGPANNYDYAAAFTSPNYVAGTTGDPCTPVSGRTTRRG